MREIKFRAKYKLGSIPVLGQYLRKEGEWIYGELRMRKVTPCIYDEENRTYPIDKETVCQFTGLKDKNGKEIYEGDILQLVVTNAVDKSVSKPKIRKIIWKDCGFEIVDKYNSCICDKVVSSDVLEYSVIGNVYDNPELLKV